MNLNQMYINGVLNDRCSVVISKYVCLSKLLVTIVIVVMCHY